MRMMSLTQAQTLHIVNPTYQMYFISQVRTNPGQFPGVTRGVLQPGSGLVDSPGDTGGTMTGPLPGGGLMGPGDPAVISM